MKDLLISVVIPAYNSEKYINKCLDSIIGQSYLHWEAFVIDDGSTDRTNSIIREYSLRDNRIHLITQKNKGSGMARNAGIKCANGEYIVFIDSDDYIEADYFLYLSMNEADVVLIDVNQVDENGKIIVKEYMSKFENMDRDDFIRFQMTGSIPWGGVRKAVKRQILVENNIGFYSSTVGEEAIYSFLVLKYAKTVSFIKKPIYIYINHPNSMSSKMIEDPLQDVARELKRVIMDRGWYEEYKDTLNAFFITSLIVSFDRIAKDNSYQSFCSKAKSKLSEYEGLLDKDAKTDYRHLGVKAKIVLPLVKLKLYPVFYVLSRIKNR